MNYISAEGLTKTYGIATLFEDISFNINKGDKIAIVAKNGSGKSTLLKIIMGQEFADSGDIFVSKDIQIVLFDQEIHFDEEYDIMEFIMSLNTPPILALKNYQKAILSNNTKLIEEVFSEMETQQAWGLENEMKQILSQLKIDTLNAKMKTLSGGQIKRVALAKLLIETRVEHKHTLLIMDEPTNHLDVDMVEWLEQYLSQSMVTLLLVTHDRYFLDSICDTIWEIEDKKLYVHQGAYAQYLENKSIRESNLNSSIDRANNLYRKELDWMRRQPKARGTKSKSRIEAFYETEKLAKTNTQKQELELDFGMKRLGKKILELKNINKRFADKVLLDNFCYQFQRGEKVGIIGKNGVGKSTLLNIIQGLEKQDSGEIEVGETISFGYFSQKGINFDQEKRVIDFMKDIAEYYPLNNGKSISASQFLKLFLFDESTQYTFISNLSGGEKRRLYLISILFQNPNFLIFDEPTNDLDLPTLTVLENFLQQFQGCLIVVSHDRYFMDKITDHLLVFEGNGKIKDFIGSFTEYRLQEQKNKISKTKEAPPKNNNSKTTTANKRKLSFKEQQELEQIKKEMPILESERNEILESLNNQADYSIISELSARLEDISTRLENHEMRWLELQEILN